MKRKNYSNIAKKFASGVAVLGIACSGNAIAATAELKEIKKVPHEKHEKSQAVSTETNSDNCDTGKAWELGRGWKLSSMGGLSYVHPNDARYFFKLSGVVRLDETIFMGSYRDKALVRTPSAVLPNGFANGAHIRAAELYLDGGVGEDWEYTATLSFTGRFARLGDTWIAYSGFCDNNQVFVGRIPGNWFGLDNANSTSWNPFLERSIQTQAFYPLDGLGVMTDWWWDMGGLTLTAVQPDLGASNVRNLLSLQNRQGFPEVRDRWRVTARGTFAPVHELGDVWHFGMSGAWREVVSMTLGVPVNEVIFATQPEARTRNTAFVLDTGYIRANNTRSFNVEMARQCGSFMLEGEYTEVYVHRLNSQYGTVRFNGWNVQTRYLLTGEAHEYDVRDGQFGSIKPNSDYGAVEIAARYDFLNLNNKDVRGGTEHNATLGINWFINGNIRLSANYIRAGIHPANDTQKRNLDIVGMRCQIRFK